MIMVTVLLITLTEALPSVYQEGQREREKETIFRAEQYARAIYLFHAHSGRYPMSVKELLNTDGVRFLRKPYRDPLAPNGRWRIIHANSAGMLLDSLTQTQTLAPPTSGASAESLKAQAKAEAQRIKQAEMQCTHRSNSFSHTGYQNGAILGEFIAGVAPCSNQQSIIVVNKEDHYEDWEFLAAKYMPYALPTAKGTASGTENQASSGLFGTSAPAAGGQQSPGGSQSTSGPGFGLAPQ